ncbi:MAG: fumarylacetoacetase, partial [Bacteroidales bacterium]|nr:fumarylacetoacetase [Bacteroidales bacterium]
EQGSDFPIQNIPFGVFKQNDRIGLASRIGDYIIDLSALGRLSYFSEILSERELRTLSSDKLNDFISLGKPYWTHLRNRIAEIFSENNMELQDHPSYKEMVLIPAHEVEMLIPVSVGDYTDFYSSIEHATNVGIMFRGKENALMPNWKHLPVGYHGRSSSIVVSGAEIFRPKGQTKADDADKPVFGPSKSMDFELEMAFITGKSSNLGESIPIEETDDYIFGLTLFNDLSARDIQKWEYVPLGPFLGKNFGSVISPWIITMDALEPFRIQGPTQDPEVLPYLQISGERNYDIELEVLLQPENGQEYKICHSNYKYMYWSINQQLAHHTVNGCNINVGDMYGSGTLSGPTPESYGSMMELSWKGTKPIKLPDGTERKFMQDNDSIIMKAYGQKEGVRIGFGDCRMKLLPAKD